MKINDLMKMMFVMMLLFIPSGIAASTSSISVTDSQMLDISLINTDPDPAEAGNIVDVRIAVENKGGEQANDVSLEFVDSYPFSLVSGEDSREEVGTIMAYQDGDNAQIVKFKLKVDSDVSPGTYDMKVRIYEEDKLLFEKIISIDVDNPSSALLINLDRTSLAPGENGEVTFTVENQGGSELKDLIFKWENEDKVVLPIGSDNIKYIKNLGVGEKAELMFNMIADSNADPGLYQLELNVEYQNSVSNDKKYSETVAGFYVGGETSFDLSFSENTGNEYSFNIANIGSNPAYSVVVKALSENGWKVTGGNSEIVGNLNNGDYTVVSYDLARQSKQVEDSSLKLSIEYTDTKGSRLKIIKEIEMEGSNNAVIGDSENSRTEVRSQKSGNMMRNAAGPLASAGVVVKQGLIVIVLLIAGVFGYKMWKNRSRKTIHKKKL